MQKSKGFTLIEVLVVAGIIIVLTMILVSNFPRIKLLFALSRSTYKFGQDLRRMQEAMIARQRAVDDEAAIMLLLLSD